MLQTIPGKWLYLEHCSLRPFTVSGHFVVMSHNCFSLSSVAPDITVVGYDGDWYMGRENVQMTCKANANPPAHHFRWIRYEYLYVCV